MIKVKSRILKSSLESDYFAHYAFISSILVKNKPLNVIIILLNSIRQLHPYYLTSAKTLFFNANFTKFNFVFKLGVLDLMN